MKIDKIHYYNFRNFDKEGEITFNTDGKVTIIYGTNGDGKTTLHVLGRTLHLAVMLRMKQQYYRNYIMTLQESRIRLVRIHHLLLQSVH